MALDAIQAAISSTVEPGSAQIMGNLPSALQGAGGFSFAQIQDSLSAAMEKANPGTFGNLTVQAPDAGLVSKINSPETFGNVLHNAIHGVDSAQKGAQSAAQAVFSGDATNIHQAVLAMKEAKIALDMLIQMRNGVVGGLQELMRLQVG